VSSGKFIGCDFTASPQFLLSGEFPTPSSGTDDERGTPTETGFSEIVSDDFLRTSRDELFAFMMQRAT
jgi:hypothetical protein